MSTPAGDGERPARPPPTSEPVPAVTPGTLDPVHRVGLVLLVGLLIAALTSIETANAWLAAARAVVLDRFDVVFIAVANLALVVLALCGFHPSGRRRLGGPGARPEFSRAAWLAMLFSAGLASGLLYWATAEPVLHLAANPLQLGPATGASDERLALRITMLHWGLHGWGLYALAALAIARAAPSRGTALGFRLALRPLLGATQTDRWPGRLVDVLAVFGTISGVATSIGLSAASLNATLAALGPIEVAASSQVAIVVFVCVLGVGSALSGLSRGIRWLSSVNAWVSVALMMAFLALGPSRAVLLGVGETFVDYVVHVVPAGLWVGETPAARAWQGDWTVFYWAWWLAWTPFVSLFIARISRGRTIREFVWTVALVPTAVTLLWMGIFGGTAIAQERASGGAIGEAVALDPALGLVSVIESFGGSLLVPALLVVATFLLFTWLVTSLDSATLVLCHLLGVQEDARAKVFLGVSLAGVSGVLLVAGGLRALQAASIVAGLPLAFLMVGVALGQLIDLRRDRG